MGEEVGAQYTLRNVGHREIISKLLMSNLNRLSYSTVALNGRTICSLKTDAIWSSEFLGIGGWDDGDDGSTIDQPPLILDLINNVKEKSFLPSRSVHVIHFWLGRPFPAWWADQRLQPGAHLKASSPNLS